jgi:hypothetical protein
MEYMRDIQESGKGLNRWGALSDPIRLKPVPAVLSLSPSLKEKGAAATMAHENAGARGPHQQNEAPSFDPPITAMASFRGRSQWPDLRFS